MASSQDSGVPGRHDEAAQGKGGAESVGGVATVNDEVPFIDTHCHLEALDKCSYLPPKAGIEGFNGFVERHGDNSVECVRHLLESQPSNVATVITNCGGPPDFCRVRSTTDCMGFKGVSRQAFILGRWRSPILSKGL